MSPQSLYGHIVEVFSEFRKNPIIPADLIIRRFFQDRRYLGAKDRRFIADTYFGTIKNWRRLEALVENSYDDKVITSDRVVAAYAIVFGGQSPDQVATQFSKYSLSLDALKVIADPSQEEDRLSTYSNFERLGILYSFPTWFVKRIAEEYAELNTESILEALNGEAPTALRANTLFTTREKLREELAKQNCETTFSTIAENALVLTKRTNVFGFDSFRRGEFEVQDEGSQLVAPFAQIHKTAIKVLDACAGAGGKTLHFSTLLKNRGEIFATDADDSKLDELSKRLRRSGSQNVRIVKNDEREKRLGPDKEGWFDLVLLDVPCTGTGTLRRNPGIKWVLTERMLEELVHKQRSILEENLRFVKPGGVLLYATCSLLKEEGERQIDWFTAKYLEFFVEDLLRTRPVELACDGFFVARLRRNVAKTA